MKMQLTHLPNELLELIIDETLPEGFESFSVTCKRIHALCQPLFKTHNALRANYERFHYHRGERQRCAWDLLMSIAINPRIASYIKHADFRHDSFLMSESHPPLYYDETTWGPGFALLAQSSYLTEASLDWKAYTEEIKLQLNQDVTRRYCQRTATFVLSLLPNLETLKLPQFWKLCPETARLLGVITRRSRRSQVSASLAKVTALTAIALRTNRTNHVQSRTHPVHWLIPFFALPNLHHLKVLRCVGADPDSGTSLVSGVEIPAASALKNVSFGNSHIDLSPLATLLENTPRLKTLLYSHDEVQTPNDQVWDFHGFLRTVAEKVGSSLEGLCIRNLQSSSVPLALPITPCRISLQGFSVLRSLVLDVKLLAANIPAIPSNADASTPTSSGEVMTHRSILAEILPPSVCRLGIDTFYSRDDEVYLAFDAISDDLEADGADEVPNLKRIYLTSGHDVLCKPSFGRLCAATNMAGIELKVSNKLEDPIFHWMEDI